jgi:hypothetical protein
MGESPVNGCGHAAAILVTPERYSQGVDVEIAALRASLGYGDKGDHAMPIDQSDPRVSNAAGSDRRAWPLTVVGAADLVTGARRVRLVSEIDGFRYWAGQSLVLKLPLSSGEAALRHFRVREFDAVEERLEIDFDLLGDCRALEWLRAATIGDQLIAETPPSRPMAVDPCLAA